MGKQDFDFGGKGEQRDSFQGNKGKSPTPGNVC